MRRKRKALNYRYNKLVRQAWENEFILRRFQKLELQLLQCTSLNELLQVLLIEFKHNFVLETVTLNLFDPQQEIKELLKLPEQRRAELFPQLYFDFEPEHHLSLFKNGNMPQLCPYNPELHADLFGSISAPIQSVALLLLKRDDRVFGSLNLGDHKPDRFKSNFATDFLQHLGAVISACLNMIILHEKIKNLGLVDALTGINNRRYFDERLPKEISRSLRYQKPISCLFIDVDHFKQFNDSYGHASGDTVLKHVANKILQALRATDVLGRYGGEEFAVLLIETTADNALEVAERIRQNIQNNAIELEDKAVQITVSIGISSCPHVMDFRLPVKSIGESLVNAADKALYEAKQAGRNCVFLNECSISV